eukprot:jgi/Tetstr1/426273/TSEL_016590.t1
MSSKTFSHLVTGFPECITLEEEYFAPHYLKIVADQSAESKVDPDVIQHARRVSERCRKSSGRNSAMIVYKQKEYTVKNRKVVASRFYPRNHYHCYQNMKKQVRRAVIDGQYAEVDQNMAYVRILASLYADPVLVDFVERADEVFGEIQAKCGVTRDVVKDLFNPCTFGSTVKGWMDRNAIAGPPPDFVYKFDSALKSGVARVCSEPAFADIMVVGEREAKRKGKAGWKVPLTQSFYILSTIETKITLTAREFLLEAGLDVASLIHDGMLLRSDCTINCDELTEYVREKLGLPHILFKMKAIPPDADDGFLEMALETHTEKPKLGTLSDFADFVWQRNRKVLGTLKYDALAKKYYRFDAGIWSEVSSGSVDKLFIGAGKSCCEDMGENAGTLWGDFSKIVGIVIVKEHCLEDRFSDRLDTSLTVFPFRNGCWDFEIGAFRDLRPDDYVSMTTGYDYVPGQSQDFVKRFLSMVMPDEEERAMLCTFVAFLLHPLKEIKKGAMFSDKSDGNTGKSKKIRMINCVLGDLAVSGNSAKKLLQKDSGNSKNGHDGGLQEMQGKFGIVADEMDPSMRLDTSTIKEWTGGAASGCIGGRGFNTGKHFRFQNKAGFVMSFNEGNMPMMNNDVVFYERFIMFKFGTKFINRDPEWSEQRFSDECAKYDVAYEADLQIDSKIEAAKCAAFDFFVSFMDDRYKLNHPPASLTDFRRSLVRDDNVMADFFEEHFKITGADDDYVQLGRINDYIAMAKGVKKIDDSDIPKSKRLRKNNFRDFLRQNGIRIHERRRPHAAGRDSAPLRDVAFGVKFASPAACGFIEEYDESEDP